MTDHPQLRQSLRRLLLPMRVHAETACMDALEAFFQTHGVDPQDYLEWVSLELGRWEETGRPGSDLSQALKTILPASDPQLGVSLSEKWNRIYAKLLTEHFMEHEEARAFLSHAFLMLDLAKTERLSAAQIAKLLGQRDGRVRFSRQSVFDMLEILGLGPNLSQAQVAALSEQDKVDELPQFADADILTSANIVGSEGRRLGFPGELGPALSFLYIPNAPHTYTPYLQILHYQCCVAEHYDHALTDLYEFKPRGHATGWLLAQYPENLAEAGNAFLNNAKSVESVTRSWVRSKKTAERPGAAMLFEILSGLETMGFAARRELARLIRLWLQRIIRLAGPLESPLPERLSRIEWERLLAFVAKGNTATFGVLEQRVVDAVGAFLHPEEQGWRSRGLGASVNATNISQRKIGDCDFQNPITFTLQAYEAHGGKLSSIYVNEHTRTMSKIMPERARELSGISPLETWTTTISYIAHTIPDTSIAKVDIGGVPVNIDYRTYGRFIEDALRNGIPTTHLDEFVLAPLRESRTPAEVRRIIHEVIA